MIVRRMFAIQDDAITVRLDESVRSLLERVANELREVLLVNDPAATRRLYPTAYPDDDELETEYQDLVHDQLLMQRLDALDSFEATINNEQINVDTADAWMSTINQIRLVLGTRLDVSEDESDFDEDDPDAYSKVIYQVLSHILEELTSTRIKML